MVFHQHLNAWTVEIVMKGTLWPFSHFSLQSKTDMLQEDCPLLLNRYKPVMLHKYNNHSQPPTTHAKPPLININSHFKF